MANWALAMVHSRGGMIHALLAASSVGKWPRACTARRNLAFQGFDGVCRVEDPAHLARKGVERITSDQARRQLWTMAGYFCPHGPSLKASKAAAAATWSTAR